MKAIILCLFLFFINNLHSKVTLLPLAERYGTKKAEVEVSSVDAGVAKTLKRQKQEIHQLMVKESSTPLIIDNSFDFITGTVMQGRMLNSVVSTNLESPIKVEIYPNEHLVNGATMICNGSTKHKRVCTVCNLLIIDDKEFNVDVQLLNSDGSTCLKGEYYEGKEAYIAGMVATEMTKGILAGAIPMSDKLTFKERILQGLVNTTDNATEMIGEEMKTAEPVVFIDAGKEVVAYFNRRCKRDQKF